MRIFHNGFEAGREFPGSVLALGKFDAMHRGHRRLLQEATRHARRLGTTCMVVAFDPAPEQYFRLYPYRPVLPLAKRLDMMRTLGVDAVALLPFDKQLTCLSPEGFATTVLCAQIKPAAVCVGADFCFGKDRVGTSETLEALGRSLGFEVRTIPLLKDGSEKISAPRIRRLLDEGLLDKAEELLGWKLPRS